MKPLHLQCASFVLLVATVASAGEPSLPRVAAGEAGMKDISADIDQAVAASLKQMRLPGCVVVVGRQGKLVHRKAYGLRRLEPGPELMTIDTVFDMASLTKPIATSISIMQLVEQGKLRLDDKVADYFPEFAEHGKGEITIEHLLVHSAGLIPDTALADYNEGWSPALAKICQLKPLSEPGETFKYSDVGFQLLGAIVEKVSGQTLDEYTREHVFGPLEMNETMFNPTDALRARAVTTEHEEGDWLRGVVHDPRARKVGGIAGHAGLFSTADDLARYANALLAGGAPLMNSSTFETWTTPRDIDGNLRGLGWDMRSGYSKNRGKHMSPRAIGHGGFTGTAMWIDPGLDLFVIFLSNRVHPDGKGEANELAGHIGTIASAACTPNAPAAEPAASGPTSPAVLGIDALVADDFAPLRGKRVGLIANHTSVNAEGKSTIDLLATAPDVELVALFSPEHGLAGTEDHANITDSVDDKTKLPVYSLYGKTNKPTAEQLATIDVLVFDIQDIGCRFYTYLSTMGLAMEAAADAGKEFVVLDRPNPIGGVLVEGPILDEGEEAFVGYHTIPVRHGMTMGELAGMIMAEKQLDLDLTVIKVENWNRSEYLYATGLPWVNTSPNMRSLTQALLYPGVGLFETTNVSVGRGTDTPFELFGAPWVDGRALAEKINACELSGVKVIAVRFTPDASKFEGESCGGVNFIITDWQTFRPLDLAWCLGASLVELYPDQWQPERFNRLLINKQVHKLLTGGASPSQIEGSYAGELEQFLKRRQPFLLY